MRKASRAIIIEGDKMLVMHRNKEGSKYYTLVGGRVHDEETLEQGLVREIKEETGLTVISAQLVFVEKHPEPYNEQYIYLCTVGPHDDSITLQDGSEENQLNKMQTNIHTPAWVYVSGFKNLPFRTPQLHAAILQAIKKGFPKEPIEL